MPSPDDEASSLLVSPASGTTLLVLVQITSKIFTFTANQLILRDLPPAFLGVAAQLDLYSITLLFFSRESIRLAIQRQPLVGSVSSVSISHGKDAIDSKSSATKQPRTRGLESQSVVNMSYLSLGMGLLFAVLLGTSYIHLASEEVSQTPSYHQSVNIITIASLIELAGEPCFNVMQRYMLYKQRALVEMSAAFIKSLVTCFIFLWAAFYNVTVGVLPFALGHLSYACVLLCGYVIAIRKVPGHQAFSLLPTTLQSRDRHSCVANRFPWSMISLAASVFLQSIVKHLLTQGDSMILATMTSLEDQGIYSLASNYGGLVARVLFQPIEESGRAIFSSLLHGNCLEKRRTENISLAKTHLADILRAYSMIAVVAFPLGPALVPLVLDFLGGRSWASPTVSSLLSLYCLYIPFLAFNGISEAFVSSAASPSEVRKQALWMGVFSACYVSAAYVFLVVGDLGAQGMVYANIVNMAVRTIWSFSFIRSFLQRCTLALRPSELLPRPQTLLAGIMISITLVRKGAYGLNSGDISGTLMYTAIYITIVLFVERKYFLAQCIKAKEILRSRGKYKRS
ncbi:nuclear division Rft1 protein [Aspergillus japonicus CBS 114.51]|uniref:Man(5)GlcNAc(2)-PP-dolichol translocation protein RFT1 n=2 Tax=Aspergillus TaxID=5052 RepID=A0A2V5HBL9_ASPV1|nr:nuclear division Rft1 protein [Aspergillus japonicus CBS 114.51]PYI19752.1 nuclear division Rft1 protein [Aspergillus violaceofuscus CBS 115571]RAH75735.1 nuclear division Rft1 protein [Aspergillus japonicus CBS 114.51]